MFYSIPSLSQYAAWEVVNPRFTVAKEAYYIGIIGDIIPEKCIFAV